MPLTRIYPFYGRELINNNQWYGTITSLVGLQTRTTESHLTAHQKRMWQIQVYTLLQLQTPAYQEIDLFLDTLYKPSLLHAL